MRSAIRAVTFLFFLDLFAIFQGGGAFLKPALVYFSHLLRRKEAVKPELKGSHFTLKSTVSVSNKIVFFAVLQYTCIHPSKESVRAF